MIWLLYSFAIKLFSVGIWIVSPFHQKAKRFIGRKKVIDHFLSNESHRTKKSILFHCASYGEFEQGAPILIALRKAYPEHRLILSFFSPSGYDELKSTPLADVVTYLPIDHRKTMTRFINGLNLELVVFVKYEFWFNCLRILKSAKIPYVFVASSFRNSQWFFKPYAKPFQKLLKNSRYIFVQNAHSQVLLEENGFENVELAGDPRVERVMANKLIGQVDPLINDFISKKPTIIYGSLWESDIDLIKPFLVSNATYNHLLFPHEIGPKNIDLFSNLRPKNTSIYSLSKEDKILNTNILVVDTMGLLSTSYQDATLAYVGGGFGKGIHNTLEAAVFGIPIIFGPNYGKFEEAKDLIKMEQAISLDGDSDFEKNVLQLLENPKEYYQEISTSYFQQKSKPSQFIINKLEGIIE